MVTSPCGILHDREVRAVRIEVYDGSLRCCAILSWVFSLRSSSTGHRSHSDDVLLHRGADFPKIIARPSSHVERERIPRLTPRVPAMSTIATRSSHPFSRPSSDPHDFP